MFEVGQKVKTRSGLDARILCTDLRTGCNSPFTVVAAVLFSDGEERARNYMANGRYRTDIEDPSDLMLPARDVWVVLHASGCLEIYEIEEFAKKPTDIVCRRKVVMQPGQFDN
jgi:hypothetical protein